ncbi:MULTISPECIES: biofilm/acid-resistance regulator YmgB/AriR [unclassified Pantoea]|uniref:biofilm/acid-resistance regulator YmgB/AriR n=1 Tax=unclassified Pantoea TaxID=2630326 RepID=UPI00301C4E5A
MNISVSDKNQLEAPLIDEINQFSSERAVIGEISAEIAKTKMRISNKDVILALILRLETENDVVKQDIYRNALELILERTPDDIPS